MAVVPARARTSTVWGRIYGAWVVSPVGTRVRGTATRAGSSGAPGVAATGPRRFCPPTSGAEIRAPNLYRHSRFSYEVASQAAPRAATRSGRFACFPGRTGTAARARRGAPAPHHALARLARARPRCPCVRRAAGFFCFAAGDSSWIALVGTSIVDRDSILPGMGKNRHATPRYKTAHTVSMGSVGAASRRFDGEGACFRGGVEVGPRKPGSAKKPDRARRRSKLRARARGFRSRRTRS